MKKSTLKDVKKAKAKIELGGIEYDLCYDLNSFAEIEDSYGSITELIQKMEQGSAKAIRAMIWAGLQCNDNPPTEKEVGQLIGLNDMSKIAESIQNALVDALPESKGDAEKN